MGVEFARFECGVGFEWATVAVDLFDAGIDDLFADGVGVGAGFFLGEEFVGDAWDFDMDVDAVDEGAGDAGHVFIHGAVGGGVGGEVAFLGGIHGGDEHEACGKGDGGVGAGDGDGLVFERLAECFEDGAWEFGEFIEKEDTVVGE